MKDIRWLKSALRGGICVGVLCAFFSIASAYADEVSELREMTVQMLPDGLRNVRIGANLMVAYERNEDTDYAQFVAKRAYIDIRLKLRDWFEIRVTPDVYPDDDGTEYRLKYGSGTLVGEQFGFLYSPYLEVGLVHTPFLDFEEHINRYRLQGSLFMDRVGLITSADYGFTVGANLFGDLEGTKKKHVSSFKAGRYGSFALGLYNGGGYATRDYNNRTTFQSRLSVRPLPEFIPGLQFSHLMVYGRGNRTENFVLDASASMPVIVHDPPKWELQGAMISFEHAYFVATAMAEMGMGDLAGELVDAEGKAIEHRGHSLFLELRYPEKPVSLIGRYDHFQRNVDDDDAQFDRFVYGVAFHFSKEVTTMLNIESTLPEGASSASNMMQITAQFKL